MNNDENARMKLEFAICLFIKIWILKTNYLLALVLGYNIFMPIVRLLFDFQILFRSTFSLDGKFVLKFLLNIKLSVKFEIKLKKVNIVFHMYSSLLKLNVAIIFSFQFISKWYFSLLKDSRHTILFNCLMIDIYIAVRKFFHLYSSHQGIFRSFFLP